MNSVQLVDNSLQQLTEEARSYLNEDSNGFPRGVASEILDHVARNGDFGGVAEGLSPFLIGVAIRRIVQNYTENNDWENQFLKGLFYHPRNSTRIHQNLWAMPEDRNLA